MSHAGTMHVLTHAGDVSRCAMLVTHGPRTVLAVVDNVEDNVKLVVPVARPNSVTAANHGVAAPGSGPSLTVYPRAERPLCEADLNVGHLGFGGVVEQAPVFWPLLLDIVHLLSGAVVGKMVSEGVHALVVFAADSTAAVNTGAARAIVIVSGMRIVSLMVRQ